MIEITIATIGRLTKKRAMAYFTSPAPGAAPASPARRPAAPAWPSRSCRPESAAGLRPRPSHPASAPPRSPTASPTRGPDLHVPERDLVARRPTTATLYRFCSSWTARCGTSSAPVLGVEQQRGRGRTARAAAAVRDWGIQLDAQGAGRRIDRAIDQVRRVPVARTCVPSASVSWMPARGARRAPRVRPCAARSAGSRPR